ncbi:hypothetical protein JTE90_026607 [Oedothorax gibbosus]|uniref:Uncharacterized protein n=1 Tax=Oedothorax gibbosus TaxID=931172 RepID=A0AAV6V0F3_9ARAC|nr:hypothetical protein JTE90_026607 [Oedothorax gibbosus]
MNINSLRRTLKYFRFNGFLRRKNLPMMKEVYVKQKSGFLFVKERDIFDKPYTSSSSDDESTDSSDSDEILCDKKEDSKPLIKSIIKSDKTQDCDKKESENEWDIVSEELEKKLNTEKNTKHASIQRDPPPNEKRARRNWFSRFSLLNYIQH